MFAYPGDRDNDADGDNDKDGCVDAAILQGIVVVNKAIHPRGRVAGDLCMDARGIQCKRRAIMHDKYVTLDDQQNDLGVFPRRARTT